MQTFLPYPDFRAAVATLDRARLGKQRVETYQVLLQLLGIKVIDYDTREWIPRPASWRHPVMGMWAGHERSLLDYQRATVNEWLSRGYKDTTWDKSDWVVSLFGDYLKDTVERPDWTDNPELHRSHQSNLLRKDETHYRPFFPDVPADLPYIWPQPEWPLVDRLAENLAVAESFYATRRLC